MSQPVEVFCYAAEADRSFLERLHTHLAVQEEQGLLQFWEKSQIPVGADADTEIQKHLTEEKRFLRGAFLLNVLFRLLKRDMFHTLYKIAGHTAPTSGSYHTSIPTL